MTSVTARQEALPMLLSRPRRARRTTAVATSFATLLAAAGLTFLGGTGTADAVTGPITVPFTSGTTTWTVPDGVTSVDVVAIGAPGATSAGGGPAGRGARVTGTLSVTHDEVLTVSVGAFAGGGAGGSGGGGAGGGRSSVSQVVNDVLMTRVVAGGGGGSGRNGGAGGHAFITGDNGGNTSTCPGGGGGGGTLTSVGLGGTCNGNNAQPGAGAEGGNGVTGGGGGGDGHRGGGGGAGFTTGSGSNAGGGGGGSSLVPAGGLAVIAAAGTAPVVTLTYTIADAPTATITAPANGSVYLTGSDAPTTFACAEGDGGPGIESCTDGAGADDGTGSLNTSSPGSYTYTVTATSKDGLSSTTSITYTVVDAPVASIDLPADGALFRVGSDAPTSFACTQADQGLPIASCVDSNGATSSPGSLDTSVPGSFTYTVTATDEEGFTDTASVDYTVTGGPTAAIDRTDFSDGAYYAQGGPEDQIAVPYTCALADTFAGEITSCTSNAATDEAAGTGEDGSVSRIAYVPTDEVGAFTLEVTAVSTGEFTASDTVDYHVTTDPFAVIDDPADGTVYHVGDEAPTAFHCKDPRTSPGIESCTDSNGADNGTGSLDTSTPGDYEYSVTAVSGSGFSSTTTISYRVVGEPTVSIDGITEGEYVELGSEREANASCEAGANSQGIDTCGFDGADSVALDTSTPGEHQVTATVVNAEGFSATTTVTYLVAAPPTVEFLAPADGIVYSVDTPASLTFRCTEGAGGPGLDVCGEGVTGDGEGGENEVTRTLVLDTSIPGSFVVTITAISVDGFEASADFHYTVGIPPTAVIDSPDDGTVAVLGANAPTSFHCVPNGPDVTIASCTDSNGETDGSGQLDTSTVGTHTYTVTAVDTNGLETSTSITYKVANRPTAVIDSPAGGTSFQYGANAPTSFHCAPNGDGVAIVSCTDSNGETDGTGQLDTRTLGTFTYAVTAVDSNGLETTTSITYTVTKAAIVVTGDKAYLTWNVIYYVTSPFTTTFKVHVRSAANGSGVAGAPVKITARTWTCTGVTDVNGDATCTAKTNTGVLPLANVTYNIEVQETAYHLGGTGTGEIRVLT